MRNSYKLQNLFQINLAMLLISTSGVLGRYITLPPSITIFWRALFAMIFLAAFCQIKKIKFKLKSKNDAIAIFVGGVFLGIHWITYFYALQLSNVAIGLISIFTYPIITAFLEPLFLNTSFQKIHLILAILVLLGVFFLVPEFTFQNKYSKAIGYGIISAFFYALRNLIMKKQISKYNGSLLMCFQILVVCICLSPLLYNMNFIAVSEQWLSIGVLALLTTAIGHTLFLMSFKHFSITSASILSGVQPIYGIILGIFFLSEYPALETILGGFFILLAVFIESIRAVKPKYK